MFAVKYFGTTTAKTAAAFLKTVLETCTAAKTILEANPEWDQARAATHLETPESSPVVEAAKGQELGATYSYHSMPFDFIVHLNAQIDTTCGALTIL